MDNETGLPDVHDRVAEGYRGDLGPNFMRKTQARIHWICRRVAGARILDIGASQGITAILLAREGKRVDAVDFDPKAIEAARRYVEGESELVRERIQLTEADALTHPFEPGAYDTVVLGEVLEHLLQPRAMVEVAAAALRPGGRLVVTLPFGVNDFFDHKKTYYLHSAASLLHAHFEIDEIEIVETWIALTGTVRAEPVETAPELSGALLERAEAAIEAAERNYLQRVRSLTQQIEKAKESAQTLQRDLSQARKNASTATEASKASAADLARLEESSQTLRSKAERLEGELEAIRGEASELRLKLALSEQTVGFVSDLLKGLETDHLPGIARPAGSPEGEDEARPIALRLQDLVLALRLSWDEVRKAQERAETLDAALTERDAQMAAARERERQLDDDRTRLEAERAGLEETVEHLTERVSSLDAALNEALTETASTIEREGELADRCAQLEAERARLEEEIAQLTEHASSLDAGLNAALEDKKRTAAQLDEARKAAAASKDEKTRANAGEAKLKQLETKVSQLERARKEAVMAAETERESSLRRIASLEAANSRLAFDKEKARSSRSFRLGNALVVFAKRPRISGIPQLLRSLKAATRPVVLPKQAVGAIVAEPRAKANRPIASATPSKVSAEASKPLVRPIVAPPEPVLVPSTSTATAKPESFATPDRPKVEAAPPFTPTAWPVRDGSRPLRVAGIMDEFTFNAFDPECTLEQLRPDRWQEQLNRLRPDLVFVESAWQGAEELWKTKVSNNSEELREMMAWCRREGIRTVFWNKEDPVHYSVFLPVAAQADVVFTTDADCIPAYKHALGHERVHLLPFAAQPRMHNPIELWERKAAFNFAGSYYLRYPERQRDFAALVDTVRLLAPVDIYDRNHGRDHAHYKFPEKYTSLILGSLPFLEIDKAYKGYRFGINMNTIKQSQTMFARRVFELMASNTVVVSNFSRGTRLLFGDLVVCSDHGPQVAERVAPLTKDDTLYRKFRLLGLRKVMSEHLYAHRLRFVASKLFTDTPPLGLPRIAVVASVDTVEEKDAVLAAFRAQSYEGVSTLFLVSGRSLGEQVSGVELFPNAEALAEALVSRRDAFDFTALFHPADHYGAHYLTDLALGSRYSAAGALGKGAHYAMVDGGLQLKAAEAAYRPAQRLAVRASLVRTSRIDVETLASWLAGLGEAVLEGEDLLALDEFNYCREGAGVNAIDQVDDMELAHRGAALVDIDRAADAVPAQPAREKRSDTLPRLGPGELAELFRIPGGMAARFDKSESALDLHSMPDPETPLRYIWARQKTPREAVNLVESSSIRLDFDIAMDLQFACEFYDKAGKRISFSLLRTSGTHMLAIPADCTHLRFGLRVAGPGTARLRSITFGASPHAPVSIIGRSRALVLSKQYPAYDDLYRYGFLHSRVRAYRAAGVEVDVLRLSTDGRFGFSEFEGIDVASVDVETLKATLEAGLHSHVLVHVLDRRTWTALKPFLGKVKIIVWLHGAEVQVWQRREFEFERMSEDEIARQKKLSDQRKTLWKEVFSYAGTDLNFVSVSNYFMKEIEEDFQVKLSEEVVSIIPNFIDDGVFIYHPKDVGLRGNVLSIRPFASRKYANDLSVKAIIELSKRKCFDSLNFTILGDGDLFDEITAPLRIFRNVRIEKRFLNHDEVAAYHKENGIFLTPTRMDSQGVSRDEAMSSGLVPITTDVAAIPEFVDSECGMVVPPEDYLALANAIEDIFENENKFIQLSRAASERVRRQSGFEATILREISLFN